ncbi:MAG: glutathione S-transferase [Gallionellaceae bacterium]
MHAMPPPILYSFRRCPYAMRARAALIASGVSVELREVVLRDKPAVMLAASPKGSVPVLVLPDGQVLDESWEIMLWALRQHDPQGWLGKDECHARAALPWVSENDTAFKRNLDHYRYPERFREQPQSAYRSAGEQFLQQIEQRLCATPCLLGDTLTLADVALLPFVRQFAAVDTGWFATAPYPALRAWLEKFTASELFALVMQKFPVWQPGDRSAFFGG